MTAHKLNILPNMRLTRQEVWNFHLDRQKVIQKVIQKEIDKLLVVVLSLSEKLPI